MQERGSEFTCNVAPHNQLCSTKKQTGSVQLKFRSTEPKSVLKNRKSEFDGLLEEEENLNSETAEDSSHHNSTETCVENNDHDCFLPDNVFSHHSYIRELLSRLLYGKH